MADLTEVQLPFRRSYAFIIGINDYQEVSKLKTPVQDATDIANLLRDEQGYTVVSCYNATDVEMREMFALMKANVEKGDRVLFYYAGHGIAKDSEKDPKGYLVPVNAEAKGVEKLVPMEELHQALTGLDCDHGLLILDCCFAGSFQWSSGKRSLDLEGEEEQIYEERFWRFVEHPAWQVITSSAQDQVALDAMPAGLVGMRDNPLADFSEATTNNSPFAQALKEAISRKGKADVNHAAQSDGVVTATELYNFIRNFVETATTQIDRSKRQTPAYFTLWEHDSKGEFIFLPQGHRLNLPKAPDHNPYRGLKPYEAKPGDIQPFFGRTNAITEMAQLLENTSILVITAPSGQGKSSVVKAGLFPLLEQSNAYEAKPFLLLRPGGKDLTAWRQLAELSPDQATVVLIDQCEELFTEAEEQAADMQAQLLDLIGRIQTWESSHEDKAAPLKLLFTIRSDFEWQLQTSAPGKLFWEEAEVLRFLYRLPPMTRDELEEAMVKPAYTIAYDFESEQLIDQILDEVQYAPGALPLLSFTLHKLYQHRNLETRLFTQTAYSDVLKGVNGALASHADEVYEKLPTDAHRDLMKKLMLRMVRLNDGSYSRRKVYSAFASQAIQAAKEKEQAESSADSASVSSLQSFRRSGPDELDFPDHLDQTVAEVLVILEAEYLIIIDQDEHDGHGPYVEPIHDSIVNYWPRCLRWIQEFGREHLVLQRQLWQAVLEYRAWSPLGAYASPDGRPPEAPLWNNNPKLQQVQLAITDPRDSWLCKKGWADTSVASYVYLILEKEASPKQMEELRRFEPYHWTEAEQELWGKPEEAGYDQHWLEAEEVYRRIQAQMDFWMNEAELDFFRKSFAKQGDEIARLTRERDEARATALAAKAMLISQTDQTIALNLAKKAVDFYKNSETESVFQELLARQWIGYYQYNFNRHQGSVDAVAFGGKKWAATGSADQTAMIWDLRTGKWIRTLEGHSGKITSVSFHVSGSLLTTSADHSAILWDVRSGNKRWTCRQEGPITAGVFSPDGTSVLTGSSDGKVIRWDLTSGKQVRILLNQPTGISSLDFSPDGSHLLVGLANKTVLLWSMESGEAVRSFGNKYGYQNEMRAIFASQGTYALTHATIDARVTLWDWKTGEEKRTFSGDQMKAACFLARDRQVITTDRNQLKFWSISSMMDKPAHMTFLGHSKPIQAVAVSGQSLLTGSRDKTAKLWYWPLAIYQGEKGKAKEKAFHEAIRTGWHPKVYQLSMEELKEYGVLG